VADNMPMPLVHVAASTPLAAAVWLYTGSISGAVIAWCAGVLVDVDHLVDSWLYLRRFELSPRIIVAAIKRSGRLYIPLHALEWLAVAAVLALVFPVPIILGLAAGYGLHIAMDVAFNHVPVKMYLLSCRAAGKFSYKRKSG